MDKFVDKDGNTVLTIKDDGTVKKDEKYFEDKKKKKKKDEKDDTTESKVLSRDGDDSPDREQT